MASIITFGPQMKYSWSAYGSGRCRLNTSALMKPFSPVQSAGCYST